MAFQIASYNEYCTRCDTKLYTVAIARCFHDVMFLDFVITAFKTFKLLVIGIRSERDNWGGYINQISIILNPGTVKKDYIVKEGDHTIVLCFMRISLLCVMY